MAVTLIVEDGTGITDANSYVAQADAITYATNWNNTPFINATSDSQNAALFSAAYALDRLYGRRYISVVPATSTQGLLWPRYTIMGNDFRIYNQGQIPQCVMDAQCELANMFLLGTNLFPNESTVRLYKESALDVGPIKQQFAYWQTPKDTERYDGFRKVELILFPVVEGDNNNGARISL